MSANPTPLDSGNREASEWPTCKCGHAIALHDMGIAECDADGCLCEAFRLRSPITSSAPISSSASSSPAISEGVPSDPPTITIGGIELRFVGRVLERRFGENLPWHQALYTSVGPDDAERYAEFCRRNRRATPRQGESSPPSEPLHIRDCDDGATVLDVVREAGGFSFQISINVNRFTDHLCVLVGPENGVELRRFLAAPIPEERRDDEAATATLYEAARAFCAELQEDAEGVPQSELAALHRALDAHENSAAEERRETRDEEIAALRQESTRLRALLPYVQHRDSEWMGHGEGERWTEACKIAPWTNRFGVVYGSAAKPHACTCGLDDLRATPLKEPR